MLSTRKTKKLAALLMALLMAVSAASCGDAATVDESSSETSAPTESATEASTTTTKKVTTTTTTTLPPLPIMSTYEESHGKNDDMVGWLNIPIYDHDPDPELQRDVDYPVVQGEDNKFYLTHDFDGNESTNGAMFADYQCDFSDTRKRPANTIIYGHNMRTGHTLAKLVTYYPWYFKHKGTLPSLAQYEFAPTITFNTLYEENTYKVFAAMFVNTQEKHGDVFKYYKRRTIKNEGEFYDYIGNIMDRSVFYTDVDLQYGDELLTLSTCYYPLDNGTNHVDTRFVVFARRVRDGESPEVDTSKAYINNDPLYFRYWYQINGGSWGGRKWDTSKVKGFDKYYETHEPSNELIVPAID